MAITDNSSPHSLLPSFLYSASSTRSLSLECLLSRSPISPVSSLPSLEGPSSIGWSHSVAVLTQAPSELGILPYASIFLSYTLPYPLLGLIFLLHELSDDAVSIYRLINGIPFPTRQCPTAPNPASTLLDLATMPEEREENMDTDNDDDDDERGSTHKGAC